jgi:uncharacterized protein YndB with AHSA1/START domain
MNQPLYSVGREYPVSISRLWRAWTEASELQQWYSGYGFEIVPDSATSESIVGGPWSIAIDVSANGFIAYFWGKYTEVEFQKKLVHTMHYSHDELEFNLRSDDIAFHLIRIDFEDREASSFLKFQQFGDLDAEEAEAAKDGMESYLDSLENFLKSVF